MANKGFSLEIESDRSSSAKAGFSKPVWDHGPTYSTPPLPEGGKAPRFISLSAVLHMAVLGAVLFLSPLLETPRRETVTIEFGEMAAEPLGTQALLPASGAPAEQEVMPAAQPEKVAAEPAKPDDIVVAKPAPVVQAPQVEPVQPAKPTPPPPKPAPAPPKVAAAPKAAPAVAKPAAAAPAISTVEESDVAVPTSLDDVETPELEETQFNDKAVAEFDEKDLTSDFEKVDNKNSKGVQALAKDLEQDSDSLAQEQEEALAAADAKAKADSQAIAAHAENMRNKNALAIANAQAQEKAAQEGRARAAAAAAAALAAQKAAAAEAQKNAGNGSGAGTGAGAESTNGGVPTGVRSLAQLRQVPGNPRPTYSAAERVARHEGETVFLAYITKTGTPTEFKKVKTTGYENLDGKTLAALKRWKFYPGQEGWVEIPFRWEIRGESQETSALNRQVPEKSEE